MAQIILDSNNNLIQGDFDNATLNNRTKLQTTTTNATTNVYVVPNGSSTSAGVSVANNSNLTNASKIVMATNGTTDTQIISGVNGSGSYLPLSFYTNNALAMQITTGGIISAVGGGIQFPATQIPSADANTLDDYEEGTFTPTFVATGCTFSYSLQSGLYIKVGKMVYVQIIVRGQASGATGNSVAVGGLPFTAATTGLNFGGLAIGQITLVTYGTAPTTAYVNDGNTTIALGTVINGTASGFLTASTLTNTSSGFVLGGCYYAAS